MSKKSIKKGSDIIVLSGKDKGAKGVVMQIDRDKNKVVVSGVNLYKRHMKPTKERPGEIILKEMPIDLSNIALV